MARIHIIYREREQNVEMCVPIRGASKMLRTNCFVNGCCVSYILAVRGQVAMAGLHHLKHFKPNLLVKSSFSFRPL